MHYAYGQRAAFLKLGYDLDDAGQVLQAVKKYKLPKASRRTMAELQGTPVTPKMHRTQGAAAMHPMSFHTNDQKKLFGRMAEKIPEQAEMYNGMVGTLSKDAPQLAPIRAVMGDRPKGVIFGGGSDPRRMLADATMMPNPPKMSPEQYKMMHSVIGGHELDELGADLNGAMLGFGHYSPDVMLKEHNRLATMPEGYEPVRQIFQHARGIRGEANALSDYGITYGQGERLNRHQRKHISRLMEDDVARYARTEAQEQLEAAAREVPDGEIRWDSTPPIAALAKQGSWKTTLENPHGRGMLKSIGAGTLLGGTGGYLVANDEHKGVATSYGALLGAAGGGGAKHLLNRRAGTANEAAKDALHKAYVAKSKEYAQRRAPFEAEYAQHHNNAMKARADFKNLSPEDQIAAKPRYQDYRGTLQDEMEKIMERKWEAVGREENLAHHDYRLDEEDLEDAYTARLKRLF